MNWPSSLEHAFLTIRLSYENKQGDSYKAPEHSVYSVGGRDKKGLGFGGQQTEVTLRQEEWRVDIKYNPEGEARNRYESYSQFSPVDTNTPTQGR